VRKVSDSPAKAVAVGMPIDWHTLHRSVRAALPYTDLTNSHTVMWWGGLVKGDRCLPSFLVVGAKAVADTADGLYEFEIGAELLTECGDMNVDVTVDDEGIVTLEVIEKLISGEYLASVGYEAAQNAEF
jgi:hypothetical protein